jgi:hypothetical protein
VIEHGVPDYLGVSHEAIKKEYNLGDRQVLLTFGFLGRNKGIETVINALLQWWRGIRRFSTSCWAPHIPYPQVFGRRVPEVPEQAGERP